MVVVNNVVYKSLRKEGTLKTVRPLNFKRFFGTFKGYTKKKNNQVNWIGKRNFI